MTQPATQRKERHDCPEDYMHHYTDGDYCFGCSKRFPPTSLTSGASNIYFNPLNTIIPQVSKKEEDPEEIFEDSFNLGGNDYAKLMKRYNITKKLADKYELKLVNKEVRNMTKSYFKYLLLPVFDNEGKITYWQARYWDEEKYLLEDRKLKWLSCHKSAKDIVWKSWFENGYAERVVLVEGILDAIRVAEVSPSIALMGTYFKEKKDLINWKTCVTIFLDADALTKALEMKKIFGNSCKVIFGSKDPSEYKTKELENVFSGIMGYVKGG